ncbi:MAG: enolase, partial [Methanomicrobiales archaeon]|nr:enolase [Methanomicrobiales archaeon]
MTTIEQIRLREILDSRGNPTVEAEIWTIMGWGRAAAPSGASTGTHEAKVRPPREAIADAEQTLIPTLIGEDAGDQVGFDTRLREFDGTPNFGKIGANVAVALSMACGRAAATALNMDLFRYLGGVFAGTTPLPLGNMIGGGAHAANATEIQEFLVVPTGAADAGEAVFANAAVHRKVRELLADQGISAGKGDEGAWAPPISDAQAFDTLTQAVGLVSDTLMLNINMGVDVAASQMWDGEVYRYRDRSRTTEEQISYIAELVDTHGLVYVEDPLHE